MDSLAVRFQSAFETVEDYDGYLGAETVNLNTPLTRGRSLETNLLPERRIVFRHFAPKSRDRNKACGVYGLIKEDPETEDYSVELLHAFADASGNDVGYFYEAFGQPSPEVMMDLIEQTIGHLLVDKP